VLSLTSVAHSYWAGRAAPAYFLALWAANIFGPPTFEHLGNVADGLVILFSHCEINFVCVRSVEVRPAICTDTNPNPNCKLSLLVNGKKSKTR